MNYNKALLIMMILEIIIVLGAIYIGARMGSIGIGFAGGVGVLILTVGLGLTPGAIPIDVMLIIMSVITAIAAMQEAGGMDYLVSIAEKLLRKHPKHITFLAPIVTYFMTLFAGTGHTAFSTLPVIAEVAKEQGIRPSRPLSIAVVASQVAITASPISAAVVFFSGILEPFGVDYLVLLAVCIPSTFIACLIGAAVASMLGKPLAQDPIYKQRLASGLVKTRGETQVTLLPGAKRSVGIFLIAIVAVMSYATAISDKVGLITHPVLSRDVAIMLFMLSAAAAITWFCRLDASKISNASTFKSGMSNHIDEIKDVAGTLLQSQPWLLSVALFFASMLLYSQGATTKALMPAALAIGVSPLTAIASFAAVSALFVLPTYPTLLAAVEMDDTGSTRIGKAVFNHPFLIPGVVTITSSVLLAFLFGSLML